MSEDLPYTITKIWDCYKMPDKIREQFFKTCQNCGYHSDQNVSWELFEQDEDEDCIVSNWLRQNGSVDDDEIITYWW